MGFTELTDAQLAPNLSFPLFRTPALVASYTPSFFFIYNPILYNAGRLCKDLHANTKDPSIISTARNLKKKSLREVNKHISNN
jgi:hypothetical protein